MQRYKILSWVVILVVSAVSWVYCDLTSHTEADLDAYLLAVDGDANGVPDAFKHEYGGLEADVSAYDGLIGVTGGATVEVNSAAELESFANLGAFANEFLDDANQTEMLVTLGIGTAGIVNIIDEDDFATDSATRPPSQQSVKAYGVANWQEHIFNPQFTVIAPNDLDDATRDQLVIYSNDSGATQVIDTVLSWSDTDNTAYTIYECTDWTMATCASQQAITIATNGTSGFYDSTDVDINVETGHLVYLDFDDVDVPGQVKGTLVLEAR